MKEGKSTGQMLATMGRASLWPNKWVNHYDHNTDDDPAARLALFKDFAAKLALDYDLELRNTTVRVRFSLEVKP